MLHTTKQEGDGTMAIFFFSSLLFSHGLRQAGQAQPHAHFAPLLSGILYLSSLLFTNSVACSNDHGRYPLGAYIIM